MFFMPKHKSERKTLMASFSMPSLASKSTNLNENRPDPIQLKPKPSGETANETRRILTNGELISSLFSVVHNECYS